MPSSHRHSSDPFEDPPSTHRNPFDDPHSSASESERSSLDGQAILPGRSHRSAGRERQSSRGSRSLDRDPNRSSSPDERIHPPPRTHPREERRPPQHTFDVEDSGAEPPVAGHTSRRRRAVQWWKRRVMPSHACTWLQLILILASRARFCSSEASYVKLV
jgi:hypothetical protein